MEAPGSRSVLGVLLVSAVALMFLVDGARSNAESDVLTTLRSSLSDPQQVLDSWDPTLADPCTWFHVTCNSDDRVTRLDLRQDGLSGQLVPGVGSLDQLEYLVLAGNSLNGSIPAELGNLKNLVVMDLYENSLTGSIPSSFSSNLQSLRFLRLQNNKLSGKVPIELASIPNLRILNISNNNLCGIVPIELLRIEFLDISNNPGLGSPCP